MSGPNTRICINLQIHLEKQKLNTTTSLIMVSTKKNKKVKLAGLHKDVTIDEDTVGETKYDDFHTLNPESVVPTLVKALQEAVAKIDALETRIKTLES